MSHDHAVQLAALLTFTLFIGRAWMRHERARQDVEAAKAGLELRQKQARRAAVALGTGLFVAYVIVRVYVVKNGG
jgi:ABC-type Fe3+ transport system permease subunit